MNRSSIVLASHKGVATSTVKSPGVITHTINTRHDQIAVATDERKLYLLEGEHWWYLGGVRGDIK
jgi:hypothetical protein